MLSGTFFTANRNTSWPSMVMSPSSGFVPVRKFPRVLEVQERIGPFVPSEPMSISSTPVSSAFKTAAPAPSPNSTQVPRSVQSVTLLKVSAPMIRAVL